MNPFVTPLTSFVGRAASIEEVAGLLGRHRMVTLIGSGGCGKTRLALEVARPLASRFADGGVFVDLAPIDEPGLVASAIASAAGVSEAGAAPLPELLVHALADRDVLVLVDNCERVVEACAEILYRLLLGCPRLVLLATSRVPLRIEGEVVWPVAPLSVPAATPSDAFVGVQGSESGRLLLDRTSLARPGYEMASSEAAAAAAICRRLDGIPLAIELAASRWRTLGPAEIVAGLEHRFRLLSVGTRTAPARQQTLEASIDWSHELLGDDERRLFRRLGVFAARFGVADIEAVCAGAEMTAGDVRVLLAELVDQSLVVAEDRPDGLRYRLLESVREYARLRLSEAGEEPALRDRHLDYLIAAAVPLDGVIDPVELEVANLRIEAVVDDIRIALDWSTRSGRTPDGLRLAAALRAFWIHRNRIQEGQRWLRMLLAHDGHEPGVLATRANAVLAAAHLCLYASDPVGQAELADEALRLARQLGDAPFEARALLFSGWANVFLEPAQARSTFATARDLADQNGDRRNYENASWGLGWVAATSGQLAQSRDVLSKGISVARARRSLGLRYGLTMLGYVHILQARLARAEAVLDEAASFFVGDGDRFNRDRATTWRALAAMYEGRYDEARRGLDDAIASADAVSNPPMFGPLQLALLERAVGDDAAAGTMAEAALPALRQLGFPPWFAVQALVCLADVTAATTPATASERLREAESLAEASANPLAAAVAALGAARSAVAGGDHDVARAHLERALRVTAEAEFRIGAIDALEAWSVLLAGRDPAAAGALLAAVDDERERTGYVRFPADQGRYDEARRRIGGSRRDAPVLDLDGAVAVALGEERALVAAEPVGDAESAWRSLTPAERRVAELVAEGLTNPEIGERLFISRRTVQVHLSHVFAKLGMTSRTQLAAALHRRGTTSG